MSWRVLVSVGVACGLVLGVRAAVVPADKAADPAKLARERLEAARQAHDAAWGEFKPFDLSKGDGEDVYR